MKEYLVVIHFALAVVLRRGVAQINPRGKSPSLIFLSTRFDYPFSSPRGTWGILRLVAARDLPKSSVECYVVNMRTPKGLCAKCCGNVKHEVSSSVLDDMNIPTVSMVEKLTAISICFQFPLEILIVPVVAHTSPVLPRCPRISARRWWVCRQ